MDKNMYKVNSEVSKPSTGISSFYIDELEKIVNKASASSAKLTYYYEDRDTNPLKNVLTSKMIADSFTAYHRHDFFEINYVAKGTLYENIGGKSFAVREGELLFMSTDVYHACCPSTGTLCYNLLFNKKWLAAIAESFEKYDTGNYLTSIINNKIYSVFSFGKDSDELSSQVQKIWNMSNTLVHHIDLYENLSMENAASEFLLLLTKFPRHEYNFVSGKNETENDYTPDDIIRYINDNYDKINLTDTAARFGYSKSQLHRIIKQNTGYSFSEIILHVRMQRARHYLINTHLPMKSVAYLLGLDSAEHFSRMFKKNRGMTPKEYRDRYMRASVKRKKQTTVSKK